MKICIWTGYIFKLGGTKRVITVIANELVKEHDITIMSFDSPSSENRQMYGLDERVKLDYVKPSKYRDGGTKGKIRGVFRKWNNLTGMFNTEKHSEFLQKIYYPEAVMKKWVRHLNKKDYDVIIATANFSLILGIISDRLKAKTIGWEHNCYSAYFGQKNILFWKKEWIVRKNMTKLDKCVVLNDYDAKEYEEKVGVHCIAMDNPRSFKSEVKTDPSQKRFFVAVRFVEAKGLDLLISAFEKFCTMNDEWELWIAGDGPLYGEVTKSVEEKNLSDRVKFIGMTDNVQKYYLQSSVYLLSSRWEGWGLVIVEAFEMGLPVISFDIIPVDLIITNGEDGFIVDQFDTYMFAAMMLKLANDDKLRKEMAAKAILKAEKYSVETVSERWDKMLKEIVGLEK